MSRGSKTDPALHGLQTLSNPGNPLGFSLEFRDQAALVCLTKRKVAQLFHLDRLEMEIPSVSFPFDVSGGAENFRHRRCRLRLCQLSVSEGDLERFLTELFAPQRFGISDIQVRLAHGSGWVGGTFSVAQAQAPFSARFAIEAGSDLSLRIGFFDLRLFAWLPVVASALVAQLARALVPYGCKHEQNAFLVFDPISKLVRWLLPSHGWKIPDIEGLRVDRVVVDQGKISLVSARFPDEIALHEPEPTAARSQNERDFLIFREGSHLFRQAEQALREGKLAQARIRYIDRGDVEPTHPMAVLRLLEIGLTQIERPEQTEDLIRDQMERLADNPHVWLTEGALREKLGQTRRAGEAFEQAAQICESKGQREDAALGYLRAGQLLAEHDLDLAIANLENLVRLDTNHRLGLDLLAKAYERAQHWYRALRIHLRLARMVEDPIQIAQYQAQMGVIYLQHLSDLDRARKYLDAALANDPDNLLALGNQAVVQTKRGQTARAARLFGRVLEKAQDSDDANLILDTRLHLARLWEKELDDPAVALTHYTQILDEYPDHTQALYHAGKLALEIDNLEQAGEFFSRLLDLERSQPLDAQMLVSAGLSLGELYLRRADGHREARSYFERVVAVAPDCIQAYRALEQIDRHQKDWPALLEVLCQLGQRLQDQDGRVQALLEAAKLCKDKLDEPQRAQELLEQAIQIDRTSDAALEEMTELLTQQGRFAEVDEVIMKSIHDGLEPKQAARRWFHLGQLRIDRLANLSSGLDALELAAKLDPGNEQLIRKLVALYRQHKYHDRLVELVPQLDRLGLGDDLWLALWQERAALQAEHFDQIDAAIESYQYVLEVEPTSQTAKQALADLYFESDHYSQARTLTLELLRGLPADAQDEERINLHRRLANLDTGLDQADSAIENWKAVLVCLPRDEEAVAKMAELLRSEQRFEELADFYAQRAELEEGEARARLHTAAASILWERLEQLDRAATQYQAAIESSPASEGASARLGSLQRLYSKQGEWIKVTEVIRLRIRNAKHEDVPALYVALAAIYESRLEDEQSALQCYLDALDVAPHFLPALLALTQHAFEQKHFEDVLAYGQQALSEPDVGELPFEQRVELSLQVARAAWERGDSPSALHAYQQYMKLMGDRGYAQVELETYERLELLLREARQYAELVELYSLWLKSGLVPERHIGIQRSIALLQFEHLHKSDEAIDLLSDLVRSHLDEQAAVRELAQMLRKSARWEQLARLLGNQWDKAPGEKERLERLEELAELYQLRLHDPQEAITRYSQLLEMGHKTARQRLVGLYHQEGMFQQLVELLQNQVTQESQNDTASELWQQIGQLAKDELKDRSLALQAFESAFDAVPSDQNQAEVLSLLRESGLADRLEAFLARSAAMVSDEQTRRRLLLERADVCLTRLGDKQQALESMQQALTIKLDESVAHRAQALCEELEDYQTVAELQQMLIELADSDVAAARRIFRLGQIYLSKLSESAKAIEAFEKACQLDPTWLEPNLTLAQALESREEFEKLVEVKVRIAHVVSDKQERGEMLCQAAQLAFEKLEQPERGVELLRRAAELVSEPGPVWLELASWLERLDEPSQAADALEHVVAPGRQSHEMSEGQTPAGLYRRIAALRQSAGEDTEAIAAFERTLRQEPSDEESAEQLAQLYRARGRHEDLAQMLTDLANRRTGEKAAATWVQVAQNWSVVGDLDATETALRNALAAQGDNPQACQLMSQHLIEQQNYSDLLELLTALDDELLKVPELSQAVSACFEGICDDPDSFEQELEVCRLMLRCDPVHLGALSRGARLLEQLGHADESEALLRRLDQEAERLEDDRRYELDLRLASIDFARGRTEEAEVRLKRCIKARPDEPGPRGFLHKLYDGGKRYSDRVGLLLEEGERAQTKEERFEKFRSAAQLLEMELGNPEEAARLYEQVVEQEPERVEAWRKLAELQRLLDRPEQQREALVHLAKLVEGDERLTAQRRAARLADDVLDIPEARQDLELLHRLAPNDTEALDRLIARDRSEGDLEQLEQHLAQRASIASDSASVAPFLRERAILLLEELDRPNEALQVLEQLRKVLPSDPQILLSLYDIYFQKKMWAQAAEILERRIGLTGTERERAPLWAQLAQLRFEHMDSPREAIEAWRQAAALDPANTQPLYHLRRLAVEQDDKILLLDTLEALVAKVEDQQQEKMLRRSIGLLNWSLKRKDESRRSFARVLAIDEDDLVARRFMARILFEKDPRQAVTHLEWLVKHEQLLSRFDRLQVGQQLVDAVKDAEPIQRVGALKGLFEISHDPVIGRQLADVYRETGKRQELTALLARLAEIESDHGDPSSWIEQAELLLQDGEVHQAANAMLQALQLEGDHRFELAQRLAQLQQSVLADDLAAIESLEIARQISPKAPSVLSRLAELYEATDNPNQVVQLLQQYLEIAADSEKFQVALRLGRAHLSLGEQEKAIHAYELAIEHDPACLWAYEQLELLYAQGSDSYKGEFYLRWASGPAAGSRRPALYLAASGFFEQAGQLSQAENSLLEVLRVEPQDIKAHEKLAGLLRQREAWSDLVTVLGKWLKLEQDSQKRFEIAFELGGLAHTKLGDIDLAAEHYELSLQIEKDHEDAMQALAELRFEQGHLEQANRLFERLGSSQSVSRRIEIGLRQAQKAIEEKEFDLACKHYKSVIDLQNDNLQAHEGLVVLLDDLVREDVSDAIDNMIAQGGASGKVDQILASLFERLTSRHAKQHLLVLLGDRQPELLDANAWLERAELLQAREENDRAVESLEHALAMDGPHQFEVAVTLAHLHIEKLADQQAGIMHLETARSIEPEARNVLSMLSDLYYANNEWQRCADISSQLLPVLPVEERETIALRLAQVYLKLNQNQEARAVLEKQTEEDSTSRGAFEKLEQLLKQDEQSEQLAGLYLRWADAQAGAQQRLQLLLSSADCYEKAGMGKQAIVAVKRAYQEDTDSLELIHRLAGLLRKDQDWQTLVDLLEHQEQLEQDQQARLALLFEMGQIWQESLGDSTKAAACFEKCLQVDPEHAESLEHLADIRYLEHDWKSAGQLYDRLDDRSAAGQNFLIAYRRGEIAQQQNDLDAAIYHFEMCIQTNSEFIPAQQSAISLYIALQRFTQADQAIQKLLNVLPGQGFEDVDLELRYQLAQVQLSLMQFDLAAKTYTDILRRIPDDIEAISFLHRYHTNRMEWDMAKEMLQRFIQLEPESIALPERLVALGDINLYGLNDTDSAEKAYRAALDIASDDIHTVWKLFTLARKRNAYDEIKRLGPLLLTSQLDPEKQLVIHRVLAYALLESGGDQQASFEHFEKVLESGKADLELVGQATELARQLGHWEQWASLAGQMLELRLESGGLDKDIAIEGYLEISRVLQEKLVDIKRSAQVVRRALELQPCEPELLRRLGHLYASNFDTYQEAIVVFRELLGMDPTDAEYYRYLGRLEAARGEVDRAACYYAGLRFLMPADHEANRYINYVGPPARPDRELEGDEWSSTFLHPSADCLLQRIVSAIAPYLELLFPANLGRFRLIGRIGPEHLPTVFQTAEQARWLISGRPLAIVVAQENEVYEAWLESGPEPTIVLSSVVLERSTPGELAFFVTREVVKVAMGCVLPMKFSSADLQQLLAILTHMVDRDAKPQVALPATAPQYIDAIKRVIPPDVMEQVVPLIRQFGLEPRVHSFDDWIEGVNRTADRVGLVMCGDLNEALAVMERISPLASGQNITASPESAQLLMSDPDILALYRFAFSTQYFEIRKALGISVSTDNTDNSS